MNVDESEERGNGVGISSVDKPVGMTHCHRAGFVGLTIPTHIVSRYGAAVPADGARETVGSTRRDSSDKKPGDMRDSQSRPDKYEPAS